MNIVRKDVNIVKKGAHQEKAHHYGPGKLLRVWEFVRCHFHK